MQGEAQRIACQRTEIRVLQNLGIAGRLRHGQAIEISFVGMNQNHEPSQPIHHQTIQPGQSKQQAPPRLRLRRHGAVFNDIAFGYADVDGIAHPAAYGNQAKNQCTFIRISCNVTEPQPHKLAVKADGAGVLPSFGFFQPQILRHAVQLFAVQARIERGRFQPVLRGFELVAVLPDHLALEQRQQTGSGVFDEQVLVVGHVQFVAEIQPIG